MGEDGGRDWKVVEEVGETIRLCGESLVKFNAYQIEIKSFYKVLMAVYKVVSLLSLNKSLSFLVSILFYSLALSSYRKTNKQ